MMGAPWRGENTGEQAVEQCERRREIGFVDHERRREDQQVAARAEGHALVARTGEERLHGFWLRRPWRDGRAARSVGDEFDDREQAASAADFADHRVTGGELLQFREHRSAEVSRALDQLFVAVGVDRGESRRTGKRMAAIRQATVEHFPLETPRDG